MPQGLRGFQKGKAWNGNRSGPPRRPEVEELRKALEAAAKEQGISFITSYVKRAYKSDPMAIALIKKLVPDLSESDIPGLKDIVLRIVSYADAKGEKNV